MNTQVATQQQSKKTDIREQMRLMEPEFRNALPASIKAERFQRVAMTAINRNPELQLADRKSLFEACMLAAQDGLMPDGREAALVIFNAKEKDASGKEVWIKKVQYMPMVAGIRKKVYQSGEITSLVARIAHENDEFEVVYGDDERITHKPNLFDPGQMIAAYAIATYRDGSKAREVMAFGEIERIRLISRSPDKGPWRDHYGEMSKKTVIRRLAKSLPLSAEAEEVIRRDDGFYQLAGIGHNGGPQLEKPQPQPVPAARSIVARLDAFAEAESDEPESPDAAEPAPEPAANAASESPPAAEAGTPAPSDAERSGEGGAGEPDEPEAPDHPLDPKLAAAMQQGRDARLSNYPRQAPKSLRYVKEREAFEAGWDEQGWELDAEKGGTV